MRFATVIHAGSVCLAVPSAAGGHLPEIDGEQVPPLERVIDAVSCQPPIARPPKIVCIGLNYLDHMAESDFEQRAYPTISGLGTISNTVADEK